MPLSTLYTQGFMENVLFNVVNNQLHFFGLNIPKNSKLIFKLNLSEFILSFKGNIENWKLLPLSMFGHINTVKMVSLLKFLYILLVKIF